MEIAKMNFDFAECRELAENVRMNDNNFTEASKYFHDRVFYLDCGAVYYYKRGRLVRDSLDNFKKSQMIGFPKKFVDCIHRTVKPYEEVLETADYSVDKEKRKINSMKQTRGKELANVVVTKKGLDYVEFVKKFIFEILCRENQGDYNWTLKYSASVVQLKRTGVCPVIVTSTEGIGKTTFARILEAVVGQWNTAHPSAEEMKRFHWQCYGKILVIFEETESLRNDAGAVSDNLKNMINSEYFPYEAKGIQTHESLKNINNFIVTSNFPLPNSSGRRYKNMTPSTKWLGEYEKFSRLCDFCDENVKALYDFFMSIDVSNWNAEEEARKLDADVPNQKAIETMNNVFKFMRDNYAYAKKNERIKPKDLYEHYKNELGTKAYQKSTFNEKIKELNVQVKTYTGYEYYCIDGEELYKEFHKRKLIDKDDLIVQENQNVEKTHEQELTEENKALKNEVAELRKMIEQLQQKPQEKTQEKPKEQPKQKEGEEDNKPIEIGKKIIKVMAVRSPPKN